MGKNFNKKKSRSIKKRSMAATAVVCAFFFVFLGCSRQSRYKVLTIFFEGVPDPNAVRARKALASVSTESGEDTQTTIIQKPKTPAELALEKQKHYSSHKVLKKCDNCHEGSLRTGTKELRKPLPELCYSCHKDFSRQGKYLHGPINVGECLFCHNPHQVKYVKLLKDPQPKLCYNCHRRESISKIKDHEKVLDLICTECHDPHVSSKPKMLKADAISFNDLFPVDPNSVDPNSVDPNSVDPNLVDPNSVGPNLVDPNQADLDEDTNTIIIE